MSKNRVVLITGHAGFIGSHLTRKLLDLGFSVVGVDNYNDFYSPEIKAANVDAFRNHPNFSITTMIFTARKLKRLTLMLSAITPTLKNIN